MLVARLPIAEVVMRSDVKEAFLEWCRRHRDENQRIAELLSTGQMRTGSNDGTGWRDTTAEDIERSKEICTRTVIT
jgi:hypothetical protein